MCVKPRRFIHPVSFSLSVCHSHESASSKTVGGENKKAKKERKKGSPPKLCFYLKLVSPFFLPPVDHKLDLSCDPLRWKGRFETWLFLSQTPLAILFLLILVGKKWMFVWLEGDLRWPITQLAGKPVSSWLCIRSSMYMPFQTKLFWRLFAWSTQNFNQFPFYPNLIDSHSSLPSPTRLHMRVRTTMGGMVGFLALFLVNGRSEKKGGAKQNTLPVLCLLTKMSFLKIRKK